MLLMQAVNFSNPTMKQLQHQSVLEGSKELTWRLVFDQEFPPCVLFCRHQVPSVKMPQSLGLEMSEK